MEYQENQGDQGRKNTLEELKRAAFEKLWIWKESYKLYLEICKICKYLPREEKFRLRDQIERSSGSVPDNIAEGYTTYYYNDKIKGMNIARKEAGETQNHLHKLSGKSYISVEKSNTLVHRYEKVIIGINNFNKFIVEKRDLSKFKGERKRLSRGSRISRFEGYREDREYQGKG